MQQHSHCNVKNRRGCLILSVLRHRRSSPKSNYPLKENTTDRIQRGQDVELQGGREKEGDAKSDSIFHFFILVIAHALPERLHPTSHNSITAATESFCVPVTENGWDRQGGVWKQRYSGVLVRTAVGLWGRELKNIRNKIENGERKREIDRQEFLTCNQLSSIIICK